MSCPEISFLKQSLQANSPFSWCFS